MRVALAHVLAAATLAAAALAAAALPSPAGAETLPTTAWSFISAPALHPTRLHVSVNQPGTAPGDIFLAPFAGSQLPIVGQAGALIADRKGDPVWFHPAPTGQEIADFQTQTYRGQPVLTWWQGTIAVPPKYTNLPAGAPEPGARFYVYDQHYHRIATITARNGFTADLHEILITPRGTALFTAAKEVPMDLSAYGGPVNGEIEDSAIQEVSLKTGRLVFQWDMLAHVPLQDSEVAAPATGVWDPYHMNSLDENAQGQILVSGRNTWALYDISHSTGRIAWQLGGKGETITPSANATFYWQHDARFLPGGKISVFDDGCCNLPTGTPEHHARALLLKVSTASHRATVARQYEHRPAVYVPTQGNFQTLSNGDAFVGWGQLPYYSEFTAAGKLLYEASMPAADESYRALLQRWTGAPSSPPSVAVRRRSGRTVVYASWNGATRVARWQILAGARRGHLSVLAGARRSGFETTIRLRQGARYVQVRALDSRGHILRSSRVVSGRGG